jgi:hypothetical protein
MDTLQTPAQTLCPHCGNQSRTSDFCSNCSRQLSIRQVPTSLAPRPTTALPGEELAGMLMTLAVCILVGGFLFSIYVWAEYGTISNGNLFGQSFSVSNPYAKVAAFAIMASSVIWSALLGGVSRAIRNTIELSHQIGRLGTKIG